MKKILTVAMSLFLYLTCAGGNRNPLRRNIGVDISSLVRDCGIEVVIGQEISGHWSIEGSQKLLLGMISPGPDQDEAEHYGSLGRLEEQSRGSMTDFMTGDIRVTYWVNEVYSGIYMMAGCRYGHRTGLRGTVRAGYSIKLYKGLRSSLAIETAIGSKEENKLSLTISYTY